ncbi:hypothetical protein [Streptomyces sp. NBC_00670]|jgi:hypothetical protein|uniref:hypothetical protein n=1 Tax=Streptomyces sp. NBC_00670 TaxID=2975804 RepID=UPI002E3071EE|nr:hypothetical protein [Streptomyces sp. NBC_00670]
MDVTGAPAGGPHGARVLTLATLAGLGRARRTPAASDRLPIPADMHLPLGCDAVAVPAALGAQLMPRLPRVGCVYADRAHWWWIVPSDSDVALEWPTPARYTAGAVVTRRTHGPGAGHGPVELIHRPHGTLPYTPPIPLYLALCRVTGATPAWSRPLSA